MKTNTVTNMQAPEQAPDSLIKQVGFTLIELSIVLVIIGLIVGGVLVGQDLIKAAEIRATIGQYEKYNSAMNTFRTKYNGMPGDLSSAQATAFGIYSTAATTTGLGDGNSLITDTAASNLNAPVGETLIIWRHLSDASLIDGSYGTGLTASTAQMAASPTAALYLPAAKMGRGNYWMAGSSAGQNYYALAAVTGMTTGAAATATYATSVGGGLTPIEAYNIDIKLDDGMPNTGIIQARGYATMGAAADTIFPVLSTTSKAVWTSASAPVAGDCMTTGAAATDTANTYARGTTPGGTPACTLRMRFN